MVAAGIPSLRLPTFPSEALVSHRSLPAVFHSEKPPNHHALLGGGERALGLDPKPRRLVLREAEGSLWASFSQDDICLDERVMGRL